jgi:hypothetical protein
MHRFAAKMLAMKLGVGARALIVSLAAAWVGCDRSPAPPTNIILNAPATAPARPTTQELLTGPQRKMRLPEMPLSIMVPPDWKLEALGPITSLAGPSPFDRATIQLSRRDINTFRPEQIELLASRAKSEMEQNPQQYKKVELRQAGPMKVIEKLWLSKPITTPQVDRHGLPLVDAQGKEVTITMVPVHWTLTYFVPNEKVYNRHELNVLDLTADQYAVDQRFLEMVLGSVRYEGLELPPTTSVSAQ